MARVSFIELDKDMVSEIRLARFLRLWFQCICPLMPLTTTTVFLGLLLPWTGDLFTAATERATAAPYLGRGLSPHGRPS